jgi:hypothetical protein
MDKKRAAVPRRPADYEATTRSLMGERSPVANCKTHLTQTSRRGLLRLAISLSLIAKQACLRQRLSVPPPCIGRGHPRPDTARRGNKNGRRAETSQFLWRRRLERADGRHFPRAPAWIGPHSAQAVAPSVRCVDAF